MSVKKARQRIENKAKRAQKKNKRGATTQDNKCVATYMYKNGEEINGE